MGISFCNGFSFSFTPLPIFTIKFFAMNALENIGLSKLSTELQEALANLRRVEQGRQEELRPFTEEIIQKSLEIVKALQNNYLDKT